MISKILTLVLNILILPLRLIGFLFGEFSKSGKLDNYAKEAWDKQSK